MTLYKDDNIGDFADLQRLARTAAYALASVAAIAPADEFDAYVPGPSVGGRWPTEHVDAWRLDPAGNFFLGTNEQLYRRRAGSGSIYRVYWSTPGFRMTATQGRGARLSDFDLLRTLLLRTMYRCRPSTV